MSTFHRTLSPKDRRANFSSRLLVPGLALLVLFTAFGVQAQTPPAPATVAATAAATAAPQPKPLLILRINGKALALKTRSANHSPGTLLVETLDGAAQTLDPGAFLNQLPWYTDAEMESGRVDLNALAIRYRAFAGLYPEVRATLSAEAQRFQNIAARNSATSTQHLADTQKRIADFLALRFDPAAGQSRDRVAALVREGEELAGLVPAQAGQIASVVSPARDALAKMDAGQVFYDGRWMPGVEAASLRKNREEAVIQTTFDQTLSLPLDPLALGAGQVVATVGLPVMILLTLLITGLSMLAGKRRGAGILVVVATLAVTLAGYHLLTTDNAGALSVPAPDAPDTLARSGRVVAMLCRASVPQAASQPEDRDLDLTNADLSSFLARHVQSAAGDDPGFGLRREALALGVTRDGFTLLERTALAGLPISLRYDVKIDGGGDTPRVKSYTVLAGRLLLPDPIKGSLWARLAPALGQYIAKHRLLEAYALTDLSRGEMRLASARALGEPVVSTRPDATPPDTTPPDAVTPPPPVRDATPSPPPQGAPSAFGIQGGEETTDNSPLETPAPVPGADG